VNFKHLYYFWMTANTGGILRASSLLHITPQTLSGQIRKLEDRLGRRLFERDGRTVRLTEAGKIAADYAEQIFDLGLRLEASLKGGAVASPMPAEMRVGIEQLMPTSIAWRLLEPAAASTRIVGRRGELPALLAELDAQRLDVVLTNALPSSKAGQQIVAHRLGSSKLAMFAAPAWRDGIGTAFPYCLEGMPMLLPDPLSAIGGGLQTWLRDRQISPKVVGEFDDWALMVSFGESGVGAFAAPAIIEEELARQYDLRPIGIVDGIEEGFYALSNAQYGSNELLLKIIDAADTTLCGQQQT
jgi:LysR family transcriptional regulator, transcriptional activator of nhaA